MNNLASTIVFYSPNVNTPGGSLILFARLAEKLIAEDEYPIKIIDFEHGYIRNFLRNKNYTFITFNKEKKTTLNKNDILICGLADIGQLEDFFIFNPETRLFFWELGPYSLIQRNLILGNYYKKLSLHKAKVISNILEGQRKKRLREFLKKSTFLHGLFFMCGKNVYYNNYFFESDIAPNYLPIPIIIKNNRTQPKTKITSRKEINIAWLSRLTKGKTRPLFKLINDIEQYQNFDTNFKIRVYIIGDGKECKTIKEYTTEHKTDIVFTGIIEHEKLSDFLQENIDIGIAMGTSALEFASIGIPTVLSVGENTLKDEVYLNQNYKWIFDSEKYNLSSEPYLTKQKSLKSFNDLIFEFLQQKSELSHKTYKYIHGNHDFEIITSKIKEYINLNRFTYNEYHNLNLFERNLNFRTLKTYKYLKKSLKELKNKINLFMTFKGNIKNTFRYYIWRIKNPKKKFYDYYIKNVQKKIENNSPHPTLGYNIKDSKRFFKTAEIEKSFLIKQGLLPEHKFVDYGCGSLRLGAVLIKYLDKKKYIGMDVTKDFFEIGENSIKAELIQAKQPVFKKINDESIAELKNKIDFIMSSAVLYHIPPKEITLFFKNIMNLLKPEGKAFVDFTNGEKVKKIAWATWIYPYDMLDNIIKELGGHTKINAFEKKVSSLYPKNHAILEITHSNMSC